MIGAFESSPEISLRTLNSLFDISTTSIRNILNEDKIKYYPKIAIPPLTPANKAKRVQFASQFSGLAYANMPIIIFTDESTVEMNINSGGIWRRRWEYPPGSFYEKTAHPISCIVWVR